MTRPDKHAARFGVRYRIPGGETYLPVGFNVRKFADAVRDAMPAIQRMTEAFRQVADNMRRAREMEQTARQVEAVFHGPGGRWTELGYVSEDGIRPAWQPVDERPAFFHQPPAIGETIGRIGGRFGPPSDILDRIDNTLLTCDSQHADGTEPWPYRGF